MALGPLDHSAQILRDSLTDTLAKVMTPEGLTEDFKILAGTYKVTPWHRISS